MQQYSTYNYACLFLDGDNWRQSGRFGDYLLDSLEKFAKLNCYNIRTWFSQTE
jgi:hypothetical protein